jgi:hypothetical protein
MVRDFPIISNPFHKTSGQLTFVYSRRAGPRRAEHIASSLFRSPLKRFEKVRSKIAFWDRPRALFGNVWHSPDDRAEVAAQINYFLQRLSVTDRPHNGRANASGRNEETERTWVTGAFFIANKNETEGRVSAPTGIFRLGDSVRPKLPMAR